MVMCGGCCLGGAAAACFTDVGCGGGCLLGMTSTCGVVIVDGILNTCGIDQERCSGAEKAIMLAVMFFAGVAIGWAITVACGFPMAFTTALIIFGGALIMPYIALVAGGCIAACCEAVVRRL